MIDSLIARYQPDPIVECNQYIQVLKKDLAVYKELPYLFQQHPMIIKTLHEVASDKIQIISIGYDVLNKSFFANEKICFSDNDGLYYENLFSESFNDFGSLFNHVHGDIYDNSCFFGYTFTEDELRKYKIDLDRVNFVSLVKETIDDLDLSFAPPESVVVDADGWNDAVDCIVESLNNIKVRGAYKKLSSLDHNAPFSCDAWGRDIITPAIIKWVEQNPKSAISKICKLMRAESIPYFFENSFRAIALLYSDQMLEQMPTHIQSEPNRKRNEIRDGLIDALQKGMDTKDKKGYDKTLELFYIRRTIYALGKVYCSYTLTFPFFTDFAFFLSEDLSDCDLLSAPLDGIDISKYKMNSGTIIDAKYLSYTPEEKLVKGYWSGFFHIQHRLVDRGGNIISRREYRYKYFFDFLHVLKNDLSGCVLVDCEGLENVPNLIEYHVDEARISSKALIKVGTPSKKIKPYKFDFTRNTTFSFAKDNEKATCLVLGRRVRIPEWTERRIYYISDLHLHNKMKAVKGKKNDIDIMLRIIKWVNLLADSHLSKGPIIIAGDICHEKNLCYYFLDYLSRRKKDVIIIPGNHELWSMNANSLEADLLAYQNYVEGLGMAFLQNCILYKYDSEPNWKRITETEILQLGVDEIRSKTRYARYIIFGGLGFSGYNPIYNASYGLYRKTIPTIKEDLVQTIRFETLYHKIEECFSDRKITIATHTPIDDWNRDPIYHKGWVYISGHTHRNYFQDDGEMQIYADNQSGYEGQHFSLCSVLIQGEYDVFEDYADGIYPITAEQYLDFARGKNIQMKFNRKDIDVFLLKRNGYYCFIGQLKTNGTLYILDGGKISTLHMSSIQECYDSLEAVIEAIERPLSEYTALQEQISGFIKSIGGYGKIHGCIIDIDYPGTTGPWSMNHIYLNPVDGTISCYWAKSIVEKLLYSNFPSLLKYRCPELFVNYQKQLQDSKATSLLPAPLLDDQELTPKAIYYGSTVMYKASRRIKTMQFLNQKILRTWVAIPYDKPRKLPKTAEE